MADLRAHAKPEDLPAIDAQVQARLQKVLATQAPPELRSFLRVFGAHPLADQAREALVNMLGANSAYSLLEREMLLRRLSQSTEPARSRAAVARLAV